MIRLLLNKTFPTVKTLNTGKTPLGASAGNASDANIAQDDDGVNTRFSVVQANYRLWLHFTRV